MKVNKAGLLWCLSSCIPRKSAWLQRREELAQAEQAYREQFAGNSHRGWSLQTLRDISGVKKWEVNKAAGRYIRLHEEVQHISIRNRLNDFMQVHGAELAAGEKISYSAQGNDILTAIGFRPDGVSRDDHLEKLTPTQNLNFTRQRAELAAQ